MGVRKSLWSSGTCQWDFLGHRRMGAWHFRAFRVTVKEFRVQEFKVEGFGSG